MPKTDCGIFQHSFCRKTSKNLKGDPLGKLFSNKKFQNIEKLKEGPFSPPGIVYVCKKRKTFIQFSRPKGSVWYHEFLPNFVELFRVGWKNSHCYSRESLYEAPTKNYCFGQSWKRPQRSLATTSTETSLFSCCCCCCCFCISALSHRNVGITILSTSPHVNWYVKNFRQYRASAATSNAVTMCSIVTRNN